MIKKLIEFIKHGVWQKDPSKVKTKKERILVRVTRIIVYTVKGLGEHDVGVRAAALTFFTLMSIVPIAALIFGIVKGFGLENNLTDYLYTQFPQYTAIIDNILEFANNMLMRVKGGIVAISGFAVLLWAVVKVFGNIEKALNNIWEIKKERSIARKFSDYMTVVFVAPILWLISGSLLASVRSGLEVWSGGLFVDIFFGLISVIVIWIMFAIVYYVMPNTKVKFKGALVAGIMAGTVFQLFQVGYVFVQSYLTSYNVIYGSFAALPLFLIWMQASWMIFLVGAELSFAYQNITNYEQERQSLHMCYDRRRKIMLATMVIITKHFLDEKGPVSSEQIAEELGVPIRIVRDVIFDLEKAGMVVTVKNPNDERTNFYTPARDVHELSVYDVIDGVENNVNVNLHMDFENNEELRRVSALMDRMRGKYEESADNIKITDLIEEEKNANRNHRKR